MSGAARWALIVTSKVGREREAALEVADALFPKDSGISIEISHRGAAVVYTRINSYKAYGVLLKTRLAGAARILPLLPSLRSLLCVARALLPKGSLVSIKRELRGELRSYREVEESLINATREVELVPMRGAAPHVIFVESVGRARGYSLLPRWCDSLEKTLTLDELRDKCAEFAERADRAINEECAEELGGGAPRDSGGWILTEPMARL